MKLADDGTEIGSSFWSMLRIGPTPEDRCMQAVSESGVPLPTGTVSFLLTDVEGSTKAWEADPARMAAAIAAHYAVLDDAITRHGGVRPVEQGEGDSIVAAFARPSDCVAAALDAQRTLAAGSLRVRMALHAGEAQLRDAGNYFGETIIRCARIRSCGSGDQVLLSQSMAELVADRLPDGATLSPLGQHRLKDLGRPETLFQLAHADLPAEFPALRSLDAFRNNLPPTHTPLIGRDDEVRDVVGLLRTNRAVSLVGTGGVGKTRLALKVAAELVDQFPGGVWWVDLATIRDPDLVAAAVLTGTGGREGSGRPIGEQLTIHLSDVEALVVVDNCEHLLAGSATCVAGLLDACPGITVLTTSREPLSVPGEVSWRVPSLAVPDHGTTVDAVMTFDSAQLFVERAQRARPNLVLDDESVGGVARICRLVDGIPLALELAAARCRSMSPLRIADSLDDRFRLLTGGARTLLPRQQTLLASVEWSHQLLDEPEQVAWRRLAVFTGPFTLDAAEAVVSRVGDIDRFEVLNLIDRLVDKSIVLTDDGRWYRLLETMRQYGLERLQAADEITVTRNAHCAHHAAWARTTKIHEQPDDHPIATSLYPNLMSALDWACLSRIDDVAPLIEACSWVWTYEPRHDDMHRALDRALPILDAHDEVLWATAVCTVIEALMGSNVERCVRFYLPRLGEIGARREVIEARILHALLTGVVASDLELLGVACELAASETARHFAAGARLQIALRRAHRGQISKAREELALGRAAANPDHLMPAHVNVTASLRIAMEAGPLDAGIDATITYFELIDRRGFVAAPFRVSTFVHVWQAAFMSGRVDALDWAYGHLATTEQQQVFDGLPGVFVRAGYGVLDGGGDNLNEMLAIFDRMSFSQHHRVDVASLALAAGRINDGLAVLETFVMNDDWPAATVRRSLLIGVRDGNADKLHAALAIAMENGMTLAAVDLLEALAAITLTGGTSTDAARLAGACDAWREWAGYRKRYPHTAALAALHDTAEYTEGRALSVEDAVALVQRSRGKRGRPSFGWHSLTPTELKVLDAVCRGLTNAAIASELFMSLPTVKTHVAHLFTKLGATNRTTLVAEAQRHRA
jgi:predicted ATPase/class 3 adenylate cyclase/DNA-binding CsgD family transcriptional regulator